MNICILENDDLDPAVAPQYGGYGAMFERLFAQAGAYDWQFETFHTPSGQYPECFDRFDAVLLTGSKADAFSPEPWVLALRAQVERLLAQKKKLLGICFGHQLIALCLGAPVARAPQGWGVGRMAYTWHAAPPGSPALPEARPERALLVSHQDQVLELPAGARLLASNAHCPIAAYAVGKQALCVQGHPEFVEDYSAFLISKRRERLGEALYQQGMHSLQQGHDGVDIARMMVAFVQAR